MSKDTEAKFDLNFIFLSLGLMPIQDGMAGINPAAIVSINCEPSGHYAVTLQGDDTKYALTYEQMAELEKTIKRRGEEAKAIQKEAMRNQIIAQNEVIGELNRSVQGAQIIGAIPTNKKGRN